MPREQNERRSAKPEFPRLGPDEAERLATRFSSIHERWQTEGSGTPARPAAAVARTQALVGHTSVHVSPILKIDGPADTPLPSPPPTAAERIDHIDARDELTEARNERTDARDERTDARDALIEPQPAPLAPSSDAADDGVESAEHASSRPPVTALEPTHDAGSRSVSALATPARPRPAALAIEARSGDDDSGDDADEPELARLRPKSRWRWLLVAATLGVAGASVYRTLYVARSPVANTAASVLPPAPQPETPPAPRQDSPPAPALSVQPPVALPPGAEALEARPETDASQAGAIAPDEPDPETTAATENASTGARKAASQSTNTAGAPSSGTKTAKQTSTKQATAKQASPARQKLSAKPRKPPQKKKRSGIIRKSPF